MNNEALKRLRDIADACAAARRFAAGKTFADYEAEEMLRAAIERKLEIVGEAFVKLEAAAPEITGTFPNCGKSSACATASSTVTTQWTKNSSGMWCRTNYPPCKNRLKTSWNKGDDRSPEEVADLIRRLGYEPVWKDWDAALTV